MPNIFSVNNQTPETPKVAIAPKVSASRYIDPTGEFTSKDLKYGLWWVKYKVLLYRLLVAGLIALSIVFWVYSIPSWVVFLVQIPEASRVEKQSSEFINYNSIIRRFNQKPLQIISTNLFQGGVGKVDAVAEVANLNDDSYATFDYVFRISGTSTAPGKAIILAGSKTLAASLGLADMPGATGAALQIRNLQWQRVSAHDIPDVKSWQDSRINFTVRSTTFENPITTPELKTNRLAFDLKNESAFGYKRPQFLVGLYSQGSLVGAMLLQTDDFHSLEMKSVDLRNFTSNLLVQSIEIFPQINIYDQDVFLPPER
ncbi:MAG: hypothetical protein AAB467_03395 [Patescibacteria group bacterium]